MTKQAMFSAVQAQLAIDMNCSVDDLNGEQDRIIFTQVKNNPGRRPFPRGEEHFEMLTMGRAIVVSATPAILAIVKPLLPQGVTRDNAFFMPFIHGHGIYYLPDLDHMATIQPPGGFAYELVEREEIPALYQEGEFPNAVGHNADHPRPDVLAIVARQEGKIAGMAGACIDCGGENRASMWQVGMDVLPAYRNCGAATYLVNRLTLEILQRGHIPYYATASSNVASQRVAHRAGYAPAWMCVYQGKFEGFELSPTG